MLKINLLYRFAFIAVFSMSVFACGEEEVPPANTTDPDTEEPVEDDSDPVDDEELSISINHDIDYHSYHLEKEDPENVYILSGYGQDVKISAETTGARRVEFFEGETSLAVDEDSPFNHTFKVGDNVPAFTNYVITVRAYDKDDNVEESALTIRVGERLNISEGTLQGNGNERFRFPDEEEPNNQGVSHPAPYPTDGVYASHVNWDGDGDLSKASGMNMTFNVAEAGTYRAAFGGASGGNCSSCPDDAPSFMYVYFNEDVEAAQRTHDIPWVDWVTPHSYVVHGVNGEGALNDNVATFELHEGENVGSIRYGSDWVHAFYLDVFKD